MQNEESQRVVKYSKNRSGRGSDQSGTAVDCMSRMTERKNERVAGREEEMKRVQRSKNIF